MEKEIKKITEIDLARLFIEKNNKENIISELFNFFGVDCIARCSIDPCILDKLVSDFEQSDETDANVLAEIIKLMHEAKGDSKNKERELTEEIKSFVNDNLTEDISIEEIAKSLNISYYYMCHFFKKNTGISVNSFRNRKRIEKAIKMLFATDLKISDIALKCGFNNTSYFTEVFTKLTGFAPTSFKKNQNLKVMDFFDLEDFKFGNMIESVSFLSDNLKTISSENVEKVSVFEPDDKFAFLHEAAIIEFKGVLYASWYNCPLDELHGYTPICGKRSYDGGKTWSDLEIIAHDETGKILYCPPVYGICDGKLYMLMNQMVGPDRMHSFDLYVLNEKTEKFDFLWSKPLPFKLNTNVVKLPNGKLLLPGRIAKLDGFPNTPAVLISDDGKIDTEWRLVKIAENGDLPDGEKLVHPELSVILHNDMLYMFNRNDNRRVQLVYISKDYGESWSELLAHDFPYISSKIYCGTLSNGINYLIANEYVDGYSRERLVAYFSGSGNMKFDKRMVLADYPNAEVGQPYACHYPAAYEYNGKLYVIATNSYRDAGRGAILFIINLEDI